MSKWREVRLGDVAQFQYGKMPKKEKVNDENSIYPIYSGYGITGYYDECMYEEEKLIVIARGVGGTGDVRLSPPYSYITNLSIIFNLNKQLIVKHFLYYLLQTVNLRNLDTGAAQSQITITNLSRFKVQIPNVTIQEKIANVLLTYDELIETNKERIKVLEESAKEIYKEWFIRMRFPGYETATFERGIPKGWKIAKLKEFTNIRYGKQLPAKKLQREGYDVFGGNGVIGYYDEYMYEEPMILISCRGAASGKVLVSNPYSFVTNNSLILEMKEDLLFEYLKHNLFHNDLTVYATGSAQPQITIKNIENIKYIIPPSYLLNEFNENVKKISEQITNLEMQNLNLIEQRDLLLPRLMNKTVEVV